MSTSVRACISRPGHENGSVRPRFMARSREADEPERGDLRGLLRDRFDSDRDLLTIVL